MIQVFRRLSLRAALLAGLVSLLAFAQAGAQAPERVRELVYFVNAYQGLGWQGALYPQSEDTIYLFAGQINTLTPRYTLVYFWPITQRFLPDWAALDEAVQARLQVSRGGQVIRTLDLEDYVLQDPSGVGRAESLQLYTGPAAHAQYAEYKAGMDAYWAAEAERLDSDSSQADTPTPTPPIQFSTKVLQGFLVELPPGTYQAALLDAEGRRLPDGDKTLVVIAPRRAEVGFEIIPETKWTVREHSSTSEQIVYLSGSTRLFFSPMREFEVNARAYDKLLDPQAPAGDAGVWKRVPIEELQDVSLHYSVAGQEFQVERRAYRVEQQGGSTFGYEIKPVDPTAGQSAPTFWAYEVNLNLSPGQIAQLWLVDHEGQVVEGSQRTLRGVRPPAGQWVLAPALAPLVLALALARRRRQLRRAK